MLTSSRSRSGTRENRRRRRVGSLDSGRRVEEFALDGGLLQVARTGPSRSCDRGGLFHPHFLFRFPGQSGTIRSRRPAPPARGSASWIPDWPGCAPGTGRRAFPRWSGPACSLPNTNATVAFQLARRCAAAARASSTCVDHSRGARRQRECGRRNRRSPRPGSRGTCALSSTSMRVGRHPARLGRRKFLRRDQAQVRRAPWSSSRAPRRRCCRGGWDGRGRFGLRDDVTIIEYAPHASDAQHRGQGRPARRRHHQPRRARPHAARDPLQARQRFRHPGGPGRRGRDHRHHPPGLSRTTRSSARNRALEGKSTAARLQSRVPLDHRSAGRHHQLHPRLPAVLRLDRRCSTAAPSSTAWSTTRRRTSCSPPPRAAAPSSTTGASASPSARRPEGRAGRHRLSVQGNGRGSTCTSGSCAK